VQAVFHNQLVNGKDFYLYNTHQRFLMKAITDTANNCSNCNILRMYADSRLR